MPLTRPITSAITRSLASAVTEGGGALPEISSLLTVVCGNSIASQSKYDTTSSTWLWSGEATVANILSGSPMRFMPITATTRADAWGVYGYGGATLDTITADLAAQWYAPLDAAGITPQLVVGLALLENDISGGASTATMISRVTAWLSSVQTKWPSSKVLICAPRPSSFYDTGAKVTAYQAMRDYILGLDNGSTIFATRMDGYENPASLGTPLAGYTDGVHPNVKGSMVNARSIAQTLRRLGRAKPHIDPIGNTLNLTGSIASTGTNVTGTQPASTVASGAANVSLVSQALQPGWQLTTYAITPGTGVGPTVVDATTNAAPTLISNYMVVRILSGAENLRYLTMEPRITDGSGSLVFRNYITLPSAEPLDLDYQNGDTLTFVRPATAAVSGSISAFRNQCHAVFKTGNSGTVVLQVIKTGAILVA